MDVEQPGRKRYVTVNEWGIALAVVVLLCATGVAAFVRGPLREVHEDQVLISLANARSLQASLIACSTQAALPNKTVTISSATLPCVPAVGQQPRPWTFYPLSAGRWVAVATSANDDSVKRFHDLTVLPAKLRPSSVSPSHLAIASDGEIYRT